LVNTIVTFGIDVKEKFIKYYMDIATRTSELSYAKRLKVGSVIVKDSQILATGYNGMPSGWDNNCENIEWMDRGAGGWLNPDEIEEAWPHEGTYLDADGNTMQGQYRLKTKPEVLHAEMNAIMKVAQSTESSKDATLFCTHAPCLECSKLIHQSGISTVYYENDYRDDRGIKFLQMSGVDVHKYTISI
jgi:dCMP deaminase